MGDDEVSRLMQKIKQRRPRMFTKRLLADEDSVWKRMNQLVDEEMAAIVKEEGEMSPKTEEGEMTPKTGLLQSRVRKAIADLAKAQVRDIMADALPLIEQVEKMWQLADPSVRLMMDEEERQKREEAERRREEEDREIALALQRQE